jgi:hypothetical protein
MLLLKNSEAPLKKRVISGGKPVSGEVKIIDPDTLEEVSNMDKGEHFLSHNGVESEHITEEDREGKYGKKNLETNLSENCTQKSSHLPIVKLPVLLAKVKIEIDIFDSFKLPMPIANITKVDWSLDSLECRVLLPSTTVFLKGILIADIHFVNESHSHTLHTVKIPVPWEKIITINWLYPPVLSSSNKREFMFESKNDKEVSSHFEFCQHFADQIQHDLRKITFVWHEELASQVEKQQLSIQGRAKLSIDLLQPQFIDLNTAVDCL